MALIESQQNPGIVLEVDPTNRAGRVSIRPLEYQTLQGKVLGHYRIAFNTPSLVTVASAAALAALRWTDPTNFCVILGCKAWVNTSAAITAQRTDPIELIVARAYTARDATAATAIVISGNNQKARTTMSSSLVANLDVTSAAAGLSGGTKTLDANAASSVGVQGLVGIGTGSGGTMFDSENNYAHPIILGANEGAIVRWGTTAIGGTGAVVVGIEFKWAEVAAF